MIFGDSIRLSLDPGRLPIVGVIAFLVLIAPASAFTANSLSISVDKNGDALAVFTFTLEGVVENAIPQFMLEELLKKGLTTSSEPPELVSMDRSSATVMMKKFAAVNDVARGTEYLTSSMDFRKAEIALQNSALSYVVSADFAPSKVTVKFPDEFKREFTNLGALPSITHVIVDPSKAAATTPTEATIGAIEISSVPSSGQVSIDGKYLGDTPATFTDIPPGQHTMSVQKEGYSPYEKQVTVAAGETTKVNAFLQFAATTTIPAKSPGPAPLLILAAFALAGSVALIRRCRQ